MYKILINIKTKDGNKWTFYQEDGVDYTASSLDDIREKTLALLDEYGEDNIKIVSQKSGNDSAAYLFGEGSIGSTNYAELDNKPKINGVELIGNKSLKDLGIDLDVKADKTEIPDVSNFITKDVNNLTYYTTSDETSKIYETIENTDAKVKGAKDYADEAIAHLVGSAPETLDTLEEVAKAIQDNETVVEALDAAIGNKANKSDLEAKQDKLTAGNNITIEDNVISASGSIKYYAEGKGYTEFIKEENQLIFKAWFDEYITTGRIPDFEIKTIVRDDSFTYHNFKLLCIHGAPGRLYMKFISNTGIEGTIFLCEPYIEYNENEFISMRVNMDNNYVPCKKYILPTSALPNMSNYLSKANTTIYIPTGDYNPATKKYVDDNRYTLPIASTDVLGGIKIGEGINIAEDGTVSISEEAADSIAVITVETSLLDSTSMVNNLFGENEFKEAVIKTTSNGTKIGTLLVHHWYGYALLRIQNIGTSGDAADFAVRGFNLYLQSDRDYSYVSMVFARYYLNLDTGNYSWGSAGDDVKMEISELFKSLSDYTGYNAEKTQSFKNVNGILTWVEDTEDNYLSKTNTTSYTPTADYNPATKKYVDDQVGNINTILATLTTVSEVSE